MKKLLLLSIIGIIVILSGCSTDGDWIEEDTSIYGSLRYDFNSMSYTNTRPSDILHRVNNTYIDFVLVTERELGVQLSPIEKTAYLSLFILIDQLVESTNLSQIDIIQLSSSEFNQQLLSNSITPGLADIITFNNYKLLVDELKDTVGNSDIYISKIEYIEESLETTLTSNQIESLELLQRHYKDFYDTTYQEFIFENSPLEVLLFVFERDLKYIPTDQHLIQLEIAYNLVVELINKNN